MTRVFFHVCLCSYVVGTQYKTRLRIVIAQYYCCIAEGINYLSKGLFRDFQVIIQFSLGDVSSHKSKQSLTIILPPREQANNFSEWNLDLRAFQMVLLELNSSWSNYTFHGQFYFIDFDKFYCMLLVQLYDKLSLLVSVNQNSIIQIEIKKM